MGDRAIVLISKNGKLHDVACYLHWNGEQVIDLIKGAIPRMRQNDASYSMARFIGHCHTEIDGNLSLGCFGIDTNTFDPEAEPDDDAGIIIYDCATGQLSCYAGYQRIHHGKMLPLP